MAIDWKNSSPAPASTGNANPWFAVTLGLVGIIIGYLLPSFLSSL